MPSATFSISKRVGNCALDWARACAATNAARSRRDAPDHAAPIIRARKPRREWECKIPPSLVNRTAFTRYGDEGRVRIPQLITWSLRLERQFGQKGPEALPTSVTGARS